MENPNDFNPYQPPQARPGFHSEPAGESFARLYSPGQIAGATWLGSPIAGSWLLGANYRAMGQGDKHGMSLATGAGLSIAIMAVALLLPEGTPMSFLPLVYTWGAYSTAKHLQGDAIQAHFDQDGPKHSNWRVAGIGFAFLFAVIFLVFALVFAVEIMAPGTF